MSDEIATQDAPIDDWTESGTVDTRPTPPIEDPQAVTASTEAATPPVETPAAETAEGDVRDDKGRFRQGKHRGSSNKTPAVQRIAEITGRAKTAEERLAAAEAEIKELRASRQTAPLAPPQPQHQPRNGELHREAPDRAPLDPEPTEGDQKYGGDYGKYLVDHARWAARDEHKKWEAQQHQHAQRQRQQEAQRKTLETFGQRVAEAKQKHPDYDQVAFGPTAIPAGSPVDAWIMEHRAGPEVLYHLHAHPQELDSLLRMSVLEQVEHLSLLSQRLLPSSSAQAAPTGSASASVVVAPRPPNPVRTGTLQTPAALPGDDDSLEAHERAFYPSRRARN